MANEEERPGDVRRRETFPVGSRSRELDTVGFRSAAC